MGYYGFDAANMYGYSTARVKALEARLLTKATMQSVLGSKDAEGVMALLLQTDYKKDLEAFGGMAMKTEQVDFALSKNLASSVGKLVTITPVNQRNIIRAIVGRWDLHNVKLAMDAKEKGEGFDLISRYVIDYGIYNSQALKEAMREPNVESLLARLLINSPYKGIITEALETYKKTKSGLEAEIVMDKIYYNNLGAVMMKLVDIDPESARVIRMDIDMRNVLLLIRAKRYMMEFAKISQNIINNGTLKPQKLQELYNSSKDIESLVKEVKVFDLGRELDAYRRGNAHLLAFEIGMKNQIFGTSMNLLRHSVLSFGTVLAYSYLKEIEIFTLRIIMNGRRYNLTKEELAGMIIWRAE